MTKKTMSLRTKLLAAFAGLSAIALLVIAVALFTTWRSQVASKDMETHFRRSLLLQGVRANTFQALKEVDDALTGDLLDARQDFERALAPATRDFQAWVALADSHAERDEVARVRAAHEALVASGRRVFDLAATDRAAAIRLADDEVDTKDFAAFQVITERAVNTDRAIRRGIAAQTARTRETAQIMLALSAISILSLILLIAAYLAQDLFRPLRDLAQTLDRMARGDWQARADEGRGDEIGDVARAANRVAEAAALRGATASESDGEMRRRPIDLSLVPLDLPALLQAVVARHAGAIARRGIVLEYHFTPIEAAVLGDQAMLAEAIDEALRRALAALPDHGGRIGLRSYADSLARIEIADDGTGIDAPTENGLDDADVELPLARAAAERHGGALKLFAEAGRGAVAQLSLPLQN